LAYNTHWSVGGRWLSRVRRFFREGQKIPRKTSKPGNRKGREDTPSSYFCSHDGGSQEDDSNNTI